jgi:hypothetical protein
MNEISASNIVHQIAELFAPEWVVAKILNYRAAVGVGMGLLQLVRVEAREAFEQQRLNLRRPKEIDNLLVRQDRVRKRIPTHAQQGKQQRNNAKTLAAAQQGISQLSF